MSIPINQKRFITIVEAEEYFSIGRKSLRALQPSIQTWHFSMGIDGCFSEKEWKSIWPLMDWAKALERKNQS